MYHCTPPSCVWAAESEGFRPSDAKASTMEYTYKAPSNTERTGIRPTAIAATNELIEGMTRGAWKCLTGRADCF